MTKIVLPLALGFGLCAGYVDSQPSWDDTGVMALAVVIAAGLSSLAEPRYPWLWGLAVGVWIPLFGVASAHKGRWPCRAALPRPSPSRYY